MVLNIDLAPTFAAIASVRPPDFVDGRSLLPLLADPDMPWRHSFIVQRVGLETDERLEPANALALRTRRWTFVSYDDGERELYDLDKDADQLDNLIGRADPSLVEALSSRLIELKSCIGEGCRATEDAPVAE
jgi:arylsulfatase A-like enzyme